MKQYLQDVLEKIEDEYNKKNLSDSDIEEFCNKFVPFAEYVLIRNKIRHIIVEGGNLNDFKWLIKRMERLEDDQ